jgi:hypothetical protein
LTFQATSWLVAPLIVAENWYVAPVRIVRVFGLIVTVEAGGGGGVVPPLPDPPQETARAIRIRAGHKYRAPQPRDVTTDNRGCPLKLRAPMARDLLARPSHDTPRRPKTEIGGRREA